GSGWIQAPGIDGPWTRMELPSDELDRAKELVAPGTVDLLDNADPEAAVFVSTRPAEVVQTDGPPEAAPLAGTQLWYVTNPPNDLFGEGEGAAKQYYVLLSGRWFEARSLDGPWQFVAADKLPPDFARISKSGPKANVLASVPGTTEAKQSLIANEIP